MNRPWFDAGTSIICTRASWEDGIRIATFEEGKWREGCKKLDFHCMFESKSSSDMSTSSWDKSWKHSRDIRLGECRYCLEYEETTNDGHHSYRTPMSKTMLDLEALDLGQSFFFTRRCRHSDGRSLTYSAQIQVSSLNKYLSQQNWGDKVLTSHCIPGKISSWEATSKCWDHPSYTRNCYMQPLGSTDAHHRPLWVVKGT